MTNDLILPDYRIRQRLHDGDWVNSGVAYHRAANPEKILLFVPSARGVRRIDGVSRLEDLTDAGEVRWSEVFQFGGTPESPIDMLRQATH
ncbi:MAG: hypothetical protein WCT32_03020 [Patescibacteria group bacterium]|jgi:hypothetical protein